MKKMNRSQSSYRQCKTLINEEDAGDWLSKYASRQQSRNNLNLAHSYIDGNKENNSLYQSISERNFQTKSTEKVTEFDPGQEVLIRLEQKCKRQEQELKRLYQQREEYMRTAASPGHLKSFNYSEKYYQSEIESLKSIIQHKDKELESYKVEYCSRNEEMDSMSSEISSRMEKDQRDKNLYIKEINQKAIQISHLHERVRIYKAESDTLKMYISEKERTIKEFQDKISQADMKKKKIEHYQSQQKESNQFLKELEVNIQRLKEETEGKDRIIAQHAKTINELEQTLGSYQDKLRSIQDALIRISEDKKGMTEKNGQLVRECEDWKQAYDQLLRKSESLQQYQFKLKNLGEMVEDLKRRNTDLSSANQKYRINLISFEKSLVRYQQMQREMGVLKREMKEKEQRMLQFQAKEKSFKYLEDCYGKARKEKDELLAKMQEKIKQNKGMGLQIEELRLQMAALQDELSETKQNNTRVKERGEKMDILMKQNNRLNGLLLQKVGELEKLQIKLNNLDNKLSEKGNENLKLKATVDEKEQEISEVRLEVEDLRERYEIETNNRILNEDKVLRCTQEIFSLKCAVTKLEEERQQVDQKMELLSETHSSQVQGFKEVVAGMEMDKEEAKRLLREYQQKIESLTVQIEECKRRLQESVVKENEHKLSSLRFEKGLKQCKEQNDRLREEKVQIIKKCEQLKGIYEFVAKFEKE